MANIRDEVFSREPSPALDIKKKGKLKKVKEGRENWIQISIKYK